MVSVRERIARGLARLYIWATYRLYQECAWAYDAASWLVSLGRWADWRRRALDYVVGHRVLEVGFGTGELLMDMARRQWQVYGLDSSIAMHTITARKMRRRGVSVPRVCAVAQAMPFADGVFDSIISTFPAGYILDPATLCEVARLLRPPDPGTGIRGGRFIVVGLYFDGKTFPLDRVLRFLFGPSSERALDRYRWAAKAAGLSVRVAISSEGGVNVPVLVSEICVEQQEGSQT
jgi:SAM-dependent methyltransferase